MVLSILDFLNLINHVGQLIIFLVNEWTVLGVNDFWHTSSTSTSSGDFNVIIEISFPKMGVLISAL